MKGTITVGGYDNGDKKRNKKLTFENNAWIRSCISKINKTLIGNTEDLIWLCKSMHNLWEYSDNYAITSGGLWNYYRDEKNDDENENDNRINNNKAIKSKYSF